MSLMVESSSHDEEGDQCTLLNRGGSTGCRTHRDPRARGGGGRREEEGADDERGVELRQPTPLHECAVAEWIAKWGSGGGSKEKKLKKKKWGRKRWSGFGQGILDRTGARQLLGRVRTPLWLVG
jgi:hypothetical protein